MNPLDTKTKHCGCSEAYFCHDENQWEPPYKCEACIKEEIDRMEIDQFEKSMLLDHELNRGRYVSLFGLGEQMKIEPVDDDLPF